MINGLILDNRDYAEAGLVSQNGGDVGLPFRPIRSLRPFPTAPVVKVITKQNTTQTATKDTSGSNGIPEVLLSISAAQSPVAQQAQTASLVTVTFTRDTSDSSFDHVRIWVKGYHGNTNPVLVASGSASPISFVLDSTGESVLVYGQTASASGQTADLSFAKAIIVTLSGTITAPPAPTITQTLVATPLGYQFSFAQIALPAADEEVMSAYRVYRNSSNSFSGSSLIRTLKHDPTNTGSIVVQDNTGGGQTFFYWVTSVNTAGLESASTAAQSVSTVSGTASLDNDVSDGTTYNRIKATEVVTGFVKQVNDGTNIRNAADIGTVVKVGGHIQSTAIVDGRTEGVGTTVQKLNSSGLLLDVDQIAAQGATHKVVSAIDSNERALIDFTQTGHLSKNLDNIGDTSSYVRRPQSGGSAIVVDNSNFLAGTAGWSANNCTIAQDTQSPITNGKSLKITTAAGGATAQHVANFKAAPGDVFYLAGQVKSDGTFAALVILAFFDGNGTFVGEVAALQSVSTSWVTQTSSGSAPANTAFAQLFCKRNDAGGTSQSGWFTNIHLVRIASLDNEVADGTSRVALAASHAAGNVAYNFKGAWSNVTNYVIGDEVSVNGSYWIALAANTNSQPSLTNANWQSVGLNTLASTDQTAKTASIALTTLFTTPVAGFYLVAINLFDRATASGSSTLNALISWTQGGTSGLQQQTATITSSTLGAIGGSSAFLIFADASTAVKYSTTLTGTPTGGYDVHLRVLGPF